MSSALIRRLLAEVRADRSALRDRSEEAREFARLGNPPGPEHVAAVALALDRGYTALESILERIARTLEGDPPVGWDRHRALLQNAALDIDGVRPRILGADASSAADELRRFRHFLRHAYGAALDSERVLQLQRRWLEASVSLQGDLEDFERFLIELAQRLEADGP